MKKFRYRKLSSDEYEKRYSPEFRKKQQDSNSENGLKNTLARLDYMRCWYFLGAVPEDYFSMVFEEKNWKWRNHHVTRMRLDFFKSKMNPDKNSSELINDKAIFCEKWDGEIHRKWCIPDEITQKEFETKFTGVDCIIAKKRKGYGGKGILIFDCKKSDLKSIYNEIINQKQRYVAEEYHNQTGWLNEINPSSLNTIRVATVKVNEKTDVIFAYLRTGIKDSIVDNLHSGGIRFPINHHTGEIYPGMNYATNGIKKHPDSQIQIAGETIPNWNEITDYCKKAHKKAPENVHFIGWDVCLDEDDISLIEGNIGPGFPPIENKDDDWWSLMKHYISELEN